MKFNFTNQWKRRDDFTIIELNISQGAHCYSMSRTSADVEMYTQINIGLLGFLMVVEIERG